MILQAKGLSMDFGGLRAVALGAEIAFQVNDQRRDFLVLGRSGRDVHLLGPALQQESDESELALAEFNLIKNKISRRNDKVRAIESMGELMKLNSATNRNYQF